MSQYSSVQGLQALRVFSFSCLCLTLSRLQSTSYHYKSNKERYVFINKCHAYYSIHYGPSFFLVIVYNTITPRSTLIRSICTWVGSIYVLNRSMTLSHLMASPSGMRSSTSSPLLQDSFWPGGVVSERVPSMGQIEMFDHLTVLKQTIRFKLNC